MAKIQTSSNEKVMTIKRWLGINEGADSDANLKVGEASAMTNFKITDDGSLQIRPGSANVAGLLSAYTITTASTKTLVKTDTTTATSTFTAYPSISVSDGGILSLSGTPVTVTQANIASYTSYYCQINGLFYRIGTCTKVTPTSGTLVNGGSVNIGTTAADFYYAYISASFYNSVAVSNGRVISEGNPTNYGWNDFNGGVNVKNKYAANSSGQYFKVDSYYLGELRDDGAYPWVMRGYPVTFVGNDVYNWEFYAVTATTTSADVAVKGIWSGYIGGTEYIVAACNGHLWSLSETDGVWTKTDIGTIDTTDKVLLFGFGNKLYILDGTDYKSWDGTTLLSVTGYVPIVATATPPGGGGTLLEQVNKLTGSKRQKFSPTGSATVFQLSETAITSVDWVKLNGVTQTLTTHYTVNTTNGTVTFVSAPASGTNTVEIKWTKGTGDRATILGMHYNEFYNGTTDTRLFLYGDGSNKAYYSGLDEFGQPSAEYFPDLNQMSVGDSNTPVTSMVRHYNRLLAFKEDSAFSIYYDTITLEDSTVTAGFYVTPINKAIGNAALGQAAIVENKPRTLDGRSIYEWEAVGTTLTGDQRNAQRISQRVEKTLGTFDIPSTITYFDKINHEYYVVNNKTAIVQNTENGTWYVYRDFPAECLIVYKNDLYFGTDTGYIRKFSRDYKNDAGDEIQAYWESGSMDFGTDYRYKNSTMLWVGLKPEENANIFVTIMTDKKRDFDDMNIVEENSGVVTSGFFDFLNLDFDHFTFNVNENPTTNRVKLKARKFTYYKLIFSSVSDTTTATISSVNIQVRYGGLVK